MFPGHSVETLWIVLFEALRRKDRLLFDKAVNRIRRFIELGWDYAFEGFGDLHYWIYDGAARTREKMYGVKSMWSTGLPIMTPSCPRRPNVPGHLSIRRGLGKRTSM